MTKRIRLDDDTWRLLKASAGWRGIPMSRWLREAVAEKADSERLKAKLEQKEKAGWR